MLNLFEVLGVGSIIAIIIIIILLPIVITFLVGIAFANMLGFTGIYWWAFIILFYLVVTSILGLLAK